MFFAAGEKSGAGKKASTAVIRLADTVHFTFAGKVAHVFSKETEKNLEF